ncbi:hypothetical protein Q427_01045 [Halomonas sp. BC04]|nr:hypothetical protein Q427_01045 [Halomonas sp. BC04]
MLDHFLNQQLPLPVGVSRMHHLPRALEKPANHRQLAPGLGPWGQLPLSGQDRQVVQPPLLVGGVIGIGRRLLQQVPETPGDHGVAGVQGALFASCALRQGIGDGPGEAGFFGNDQSHVSATEVQGMDILTVTGNVRQRLS